MPPSTTETTKRRLTIGFINWAHAIDHYVILIFPTLVLTLQSEFGRSYSELIALSSACFFAFGVFALPAGWLGDRWSRRGMMAIFFLGCGAALLAAGLSISAGMLAVALFALGVFAAIYHPVGTTVLVAAAIRRGPTLAMNGVCGNIGSALAAGLTATLAATVSWRAAFLVPGVICLASGAAYLAFSPREEPGAAAKRPTVAEIPLGSRAALAIFGCLTICVMAGGLVFNTMSVALPKIVEEGLHRGDALVYAGSLATLIFLGGALTQLCMGRLVEIAGPNVLFAGCATAQFIGIVWARSASGWQLFAALALAMAAIYGQITVNDVVIARYTADRWRGRVYAVRFFLGFITAGFAVSGIAALHDEGGFGRVLLATAMTSFVFVLATWTIALIGSAVERRHQRLQAAE